MSQHLGDRAGAYVDGVLDTAEAGRAREHLAGCPSCRAQVAEQQRVRDLLRAAGRPPTQPPTSLLAVLAAMPESGPPVRPVPVAVPMPRARVARRAAVSCAALGATVLATAWVVGAPAAAAGPPAVPPSKLLAQHTATAGQLPFWGAGSRPVSATQPRAKEPAGRKRLRDGLAPWLTRDPSAILRRAAAASGTVRYQAVEQVTRFDGSGAVTQVSEVSHIPGRGTATRPLDGDDLGAAFQPQVEGQVASSLDAVALLERSYRVAAEGVDTVAGRRVDRLAVYDGDGGLVARFWIDRVSGLPLARESIADGRSTGAHRMTAFSMVTRAQAPDHLPVATTAAWDEAVGIPADAALEVLDGEGWVCPAGLAQATGLQAFDALVTDADASASKGQVLHVIYTDGLRSLSVFQQRAALSPDRLTGFSLTQVAGAAVYRRASGPTEVTWAADGMVFTVVGDVPEPVLDAVVAHLPHEQGDDGSRTARGLVRVGSWIDPFG